jgi:hypothetical protein
MDYCSGVLVTEPEWTQGAKDCLVFQFPRLVFSVAGFSRVNNQILSFANRLFMFIISKLS